MVLRCVQSLIPSRSATGDEESDPKKARQLTVTEAFQRTGKDVSQLAVDKAIVTLFVNKMLALSVVDCPEFQALIATLNPTKSSMARKKLSVKINERHVSMKEQIIRYRKDTLIFSYVHATL